MSRRELFTSQSNVFSGFQKPFDKADYVVLGVPFDATSTYRTGARFGPTAVRQASLNIETYSFRTGIDVEDLCMHDAGDLHVSADARTTVNVLASVAEEVFEAGKVLLALGGEHTITLGAATALKDIASSTAIVCFDAHLDLRSEFLGLKLSHTTFMRRINEEVKPAKIIEVGTRAVANEEISYAKKASIDFFTVHQIRREGVSRFAESLCAALGDYERLYVSVDMDVLDPAYAPAVQNPEPDGLETHALLDMLQAVCDERVVGFDVLEVAPNYDLGVSAVQAAKIAFEMLCGIELSKRRRHK